MKPMKTGDSNVRREHEAVRNSVGFYDFTHQLLEVKGAGATDFLSKVFVAAIAKASVGEAKYTTMLNEAGTIIDDVIVFRIADDTFWVSTLYIAEMIKWFDAYKGTSSVAYKDITSITTMYAVQGPNSKAVLNDFLGESVDGLKYFTIRDNTIDGVKVKVARSGYTGELGYEIYCAPEQKQLVEQKLVASGKQYGITRIETSVIVASLPREKGYVLMSDLAGTNPLEVGFGWAVDWGKDFVGKAALSEVRAAGAKRSLLGFTVDDDMAEVEPGAVVKVNGEIAGRVTVFTYGYTVEKNIGFALVENAKAKVGDKATILWGGNEVEATLQDRVFYDAENMRVKGK
jgi:aminomethyltransferase